MKDSSKKVELIKVNQAHLVRLLAERSQTSPSGCLLWTGCLGNHGYGRILFHGIELLVHIVAYVLYTKDPGELCVLHRCDTPPCILPAHLFEGTKQDNTADMVSKDRQHRRLSDEQVLELRKLRLEQGVPYRRLAKIFGITEAAAFRRVHSHG